MRKIVTLRIDAALIDPLVETLESRAQAWQETARILRAEKDSSPDKAKHMSELYAALIQQIREQLAGE